MSSPIELADDLYRLVLATYQNNDHPAFDSKKAITALCLSLIRACEGPEQYTAILAESCQETAALNLITSLNIADLIAQSPAGHLSLKVLSEKTQADERYLSVALKCLLYHGYFLEVEPQIYANNEFSDVLRSTVANSMKDAVGLAADDAAKAAIQLPIAAMRDETRTAANIAFDTTLSAFEWMASPGNEWRGRRAGKAIVQLHRMSNSGIGEDFPWHELPNPIVDIGGGIGSFEEMLLAVPQNRQLSFCILDIETTIDHAKKVWSGKPQWMQDRVNFIAGDFMKFSADESKIPTAAGTYVLRHVLHDWDDVQAVEILRNVRNAMTGSDSKLILVEMMLSEHSCRFASTTSLQLLSLNGGATRSQGEFKKLFEEAGFVTKSVTEIRGVDSIVVLKTCASL
ncbi:S-adenosyl-L-methionine-dependent methyltransferase [Mycena floridula]|nr:S-adenosyl-L-methionine-dependent methyltransferase [Mycena floridula]